MHWPTTSKPASLRSRASPSRSRTLSSAIATAWHLRPHPGPAAGGAPHAQPAAVRLDAIGEAAQAGARSLSAPPTPSSTTSTTTSSPCARDRDPTEAASACLPMLARLSETT